MPSAPRRVLQTEQRGPLAQPVAGRRLKIATVSVRIRRGPPRIRATPPVLGLGCRPRAHDASRSVMSRSAAASSKGRSASTNRMLCSIAPGGTGSSPRASPSDCTTATSRARSIESIVALVIRNLKIPLDGGCGNHFLRRAPNITLSADLALEVAPAWAPAEHGMGARDGSAVDHHRFLAACAQRAALRAVVDELLHQLDRIGRGVVGNPLDLRLAGSDIGDHVESHGRGTSQRACLE